MKFTKNGKRYLIEVSAKNSGDGRLFAIRAICKSTLLTSCINNLNPILSEFRVNDTRIAESSWFVSCIKSKILFKQAKKFLSSPIFLQYLEEKLDEDRSLGEWERRRGVGLLPCMSL